MTVRALIVDDNRDFLETARQLLEREGIEVVAVASSGAEALRRDQEHNPDVILVDVDLGEENGLDLAERFDTGTPGRRVVLISAYPEQDLKDLIETSSAIGFVSKSQLSAKTIIDVLHGRDCQKRTGPS
jgi:CheY-like chemotaxis protein